MPKVRYTYNAAKISSAITPKPPLTHLSTKLIGQGFVISYNLNNKKPTPKQSKSGGKKAKENHWPDNSSMTISGASDRFVDF